MFGYINLSSPFYREHASISIDYGHDFRTCGAVILNEFASAYEPCQSIPSVSLSIQLVSLQDRLSFVHLFLHFICCTFRLALEQEVPSMESGPHLDYSNIRIVTSSRSNYGTLASWTNDRHWLLIGWVYSGSRWASDLCGSDNVTGSLRSSAIMCWQLSPSPPLNTISFNKVQA